MAMTDPVADLLTRIRNGCTAKLSKVEIPASRLKANVVKTLRDEGFIQAFRLVREDGRAAIKVQLKYDEKGNSVIHGLRRVSRPGLRRYIKHTEVSNLRNAAGVVILTTSRGVMTGQQARQLRVGGEYLCEVW